MPCGTNAPQLTQNAPKSNRLLAQMKYKETLQKLYAAIDQLDSPTTLALLNIDENLLGLPETTPSYVAPP